jgi:hypothetical protein
MGAVDLTAIMDGIGAQVTAWGGVPYVYAYPVAVVNVPCVLVDYPTHIDISTTFQRGGDHVSLPVLFLVAKDLSKEGRDALSDVIAGGSDLVAAIEGSYAYGDITVTDAEVTTVVVGGLDHLGLKLTVDVVT